MSADDNLPGGAVAPAPVAANPLGEGLARERIPYPATVVIFGASGDLTKRKLVPALYSLTRDRLLPARLAVVGYARREISDDAFRADVRAGCDEFARRRPVDEDLWSAFGRQVFYQAGNFTDPEAFRRLRVRLEAIERELGMPGNRVYYLSTPPSAFAPIIQNLGAAGLIAEGERPFTRVIIEKPFGTDLASAQRLNADIHETLDERQIYRIDHYLGKETVQNLLVLRFANGIFEPLWNNRYVDHVQITGAETVGVEQRAGYFEGAGILRDMVQNHLLQVMSLVAMEPPVAFEADAVRDEKLKVLRALRPLAPEDVERCVVRGQYAAGSIAGKRVPAYREEPGVDPHSITETFVALKASIDTWRWAGVPFYLRSAKRMPKRVTEVSIHFKQAPHLLFGPDRSAGVRPNVLAIRIQPDEGISLNFGSKVPGPAIEIAPVTMEFRYGSSFGAEPPEAYERLILDCMLGDGTLFTRADEVEASWAWITRIREAWDRQTLRDVPLYEAGSWGPDSAHELLAGDGRRWRKP